MAMDVSASTLTSLPEITERDVKRATWVCFFARTFAVYDFVLFGNLLPKLADDLGWASSTSTGPPAGPPRRPPARCPR